MNLLLAHGSELHADDLIVFVPIVLVVLGVLLLAGRALRRRAGNEDELSQRLERDDR